MVLEHDHHVHPPQELAQHDAFVDALTLAQRIARVGHLFPVLERRAAIIAPELGSRVERRKVDERFSESRAFQSAERRLRYCGTWNLKAIASSCSWMVAISKL